jgi:hypothetical protein
MDEPLWDLVEQGLRMTDERILLSPENGLYPSIRAQLAFIQGHLIDRTPIAEEDRERLILGVLAAREFETTDPRYADVLFDVSYRVNRWSPS